MNLAVIGLGIMGQYSAKELAPKVETVYISSSKPKEKLEQMFPGEKYSITDTPNGAVKDADFVLFCVPTHTIYEKMLEILPYCKKGAIISGQTSKKSPEAQAFDEHLSKNPSCGLELVTIHTMCDPEKADASKEILGIIRHNSSDAAYEKAKEFYKDLSEHIEEFESIDEHGTRVANTQIDTSKTNLSIASTFAKVGCFPWLDEAYSSAFDIMKFAMAMRTASQKAHIYRGIQFGSEYGKEIVRSAKDIESELFSLIVSNKRKEYRNRVMAAKERLFPEKQEPILTDKAMSQFGNITAINPNSHYSLIQWVVNAAESGRNIFEDLKATTPMYTSLLCLVDRLFTSEGELERAISAPFDNPKMVYDDFDFHVMLQEWSKALLNENTSVYNMMHDMMREKLDDKLLAEQVEKSKKVVSVCRESMAKAIAEGRIQ